MERLLSAAPLVSCLLLACAFASAAAESVCHGTAASGRLENGVRLPRRGGNFKAYSTLGVLLGRTHVHDKVAAAIRGSYRSLAGSHPGKKFMYGETGWKKGGRFKPHKTHRNGTSVDFMVSVTDAGGDSVYLPAGPFNKFGYGIEFDAQGVFKGCRIDFEAMAAHLLALHEESKKAGIGISRVIFDPGLQPLLFKTSRGALLKKSLRFSKKRSWVRHDEHYHVDFAVRCRKP